MPLIMSQAVLQAIRAHGQSAYPLEGAGLLLGRAADGRKSVEAVFPLANAREAEAQHNRYLIAPLDMLRGEEKAERRGLEVVGVFHSHPDHPARPSEFDREHALPWFAYVITSVVQGRAVESRAWLLAEDRSQFLEEEIIIMASIRIPTPLRPYAGGQSEVPVSGPTVGAALGDLTARYPTLRQHLFTEAGELRSFVNVFLNQSDIRELKGAETPLNESDRLMIVPSIAGGIERKGEFPMSEAVRKVDHSVLRTNQAFIVGLLLAAFVANAPWLAGLVTAVMLFGTFVMRKAGFAPLYFRIFKPLGWIKPDVIADNPEPHLFAQGFGGVVVLGGTLALRLGVPALGWALVWLVILLAALNLFVGFCAGCMVYYWLNRLRVPGFSAEPIPGTFPGMRPPRDGAHSRP